MPDLQPVYQPQLPTREAALSLRDVVYIIFRRRWIIIAITLPIALIAALGFFRKTNEIVAASRVLVELRGPAETRWNPSTAHMDEDRVLSTFQHMAMSVPVADQAAEALQDSLDAVIGRRPDLADLKRKRRLIRFLLDHLDVSAMGESNIIEIQFGSPDARLSLLANGAVRDAFLEYSVQAVKNSRAIEYYEEQVLEARSQIDSLLARRSIVLQESGYSSLKDELRYDAGQLSNLKNKYYEAVSERRFLEAQLEFHRESLAEDPDFYPFSQAGGNTPLHTAKSRVDAYQDELNNLLGQFPEDNINVLRQKERVDRAKDMYQESMADYLRGLKMEVETERQRELTRLDQIESLQRSLYDAPEAYHHVSLIDTELEARRQLLKDLQVKSGEVRLNEMADERVSRIIKLTEPEIILAAAGSRMLAYFALITIFGFLFSIVVAFAVDRQDHRIYSAHNVEEYLEVPVLGVITDVKEAE